MLQVATRQLIRALSDPGNSWAWYEVAKLVGNLDELIEIAQAHGITNLNPVEEGYAEYETISN